MAPRSATNMDAAADSRSPSPTVRTTWTLLLLVHLTAVVLAVLANAAPVSELRSKIGDGPLAFYLRALHLDSAFNFHLTDADVLDFDHSIELEIDRDITPTDSSQKVITLPEANLWPGIRKRRFQQLAMEIDLLSLDVDPNEAADLPTAVASGILAQNGIDSGTHRLRCKRQLVISYQDVGNPNRALSDPYHADRFEVAHEWDVICDSGEVYVNKVAAASQNAAVRSRRNSGGDKDR